MKNEKTKNDTETNEMSIFDATMIAEGVDSADEETILKAWSLLISTGTCWSLQGSFGRMAMSLIDSGILSDSGEIL